LLALSFLEARHSRALVLASGSRSAADVIGGGSDGGGGGGEGGGGSGSDRDDEGGGGTQTPQGALDYIYPRACCRSARTVAPL